MSIATLKTVPNIGAVTGARCLSFAMPALTSFATGAQAIAAMAFGTETIPKVNKIFGPGNLYVMLAKAFVAKQTHTLVDLPAGSVSELPEAPNATENADFIAEKSSK